MFIHFVLFILLYPFLLSIKKKTPETKDNHIFNLFDCEYFFH